MLRVALALLDVGKSGLQPTDLKGSPLTVRPVSSFTFVLQLSKYVVKFSPSTTSASSYIVVSRSPVCLLATGRQARAV
eukprot:865351-Pyramimonas_sp.AAC.2